MVRAPCHGCLLAVDVQVEEADGGMQRAMLAIHVFGISFYTLVFYELESCSLGLDRFIF